jgi:large subunit ribosomal protein L31
LDQRKIPMKSEIHPDYQAVIFRDLASGESFLTRSTLTSTKTLKWEDGKEYPVFDVEIFFSFAPLLYR